MVEQLNYVIDNDLSKNESALMLDISLTWSFFSSYSEGVCN